MAHLYLSVLLAISVVLTGAEGSVRAAPGGHLSSLVYGEVSDLGLFEKSSSRESKGAQLMRDGIWPSQRAFRVLNVLQGAEARGVEFTEVNLGEIGRVYEQTNKALNALDLAEIHGVADESLLVGQAVGAIDRARRIEKDLLIATHTLLEELALPGAKRGKKSRGRRVLRFLKNPTLDGLFPTHPEYLALVKGFKVLKEEVSKGNWDDLPPVQKLRKLGWQKGSISDQITAFQEAHLLPVTGKVDVLTRKTIDTPIAQKLHELRHSLRRWHRSPSREFSTYMRVNIPAYTAEYWREGKLVHVFRTVVGDLEGQTPEFVRSISTIVLNPVWYIPPSVRERDLDVRASADPNFFKDNNFVMIGKNRNRMIQPPGDDNWLGRVIFRWDRGGTESVFVHDSPFQERFDEPQRALSHGCVNLEGARALAMELAERNGNVSPAKFRRLFDTGKTQRIRLKKNLKTFLEYSTVVADGQGRLVFLPDVYGRVPSMKGELAQQGH